MIKPKIHAEDLTIFLVSGLILFSYGLYALNGYGNHDDIYRMLNSWRTLIFEHRYVPSRFQGYLVPELSIGLASQVGGFYLSNLVSVLLSVSSLLIFYWLLIRITTRLNAVLAVAMIASNPFWIIASTTSTDYIYPVFFFTLGPFMLLNAKPRLAGLIFALAMSSRLTYAPMIVLAFAFYLPYVIKNKPEQRNQFFQGIILFFLGTAALYLPVFLASGMSFSFLKYADDTVGGWLGTIVRFIYKNIYFWGLPTFILLLIFFFRERVSYPKAIFANPFANTRPEKLLFQVVSWGFAYNEIVFAKLPHQYQYLLPILFCVTYFIVTAPTPSKTKFLGLVLALNIIYCLFCNFDILDTYQVGGAGTTIHSDAAKVNFSLKQGVLVQDFSWRATYQKHLVEDYNQKWQNAKGFYPLQDPRSRQQTIKSRE